MDYCSFAHLTSSGVNEILESELLKSVREHKLQFPARWRDSVLQFPFYIFVFQGFRLILKCQSLQDH